MIPEIKQTLSNWNGKETDSLRELLEQFGSHPEFVKSIVESLPNADFMSPASWIIKNGFETQALSEQQVSLIYSTLIQSDDWQVQLHLLQSMVFLPLQDSQKDKVESFLRHTLSSSNKFVRAWSYYGFEVFAQKFVEFREEVDQFHEMGLRDEPASVRARIRNILKESKAG